MKLVAMISAGLLAAVTVLPVAAEAQMRDHHRVVTRKSHVVRHVGYRNRARARQVCRTVYRNHHRQRVCRTVR